MTTPGFVTLPRLLASGSAIVVLAVALALLVAFYWRVYRIEGRRLTGGQQRLLWALRIAVAALVILMLGRPALNVVRREERLPVAAIVLDESTSMGFPGERTNEFIRTNPREARRRYDAAKRALDILQQALSRTHSVKVFTTSDALRKVADVEYRGTSDRPPTPLETVLAKAPTPTGAYSNLGEGLLDVLRELEPYRLSGVIFLSDGRITGGTELSKVADQVAEHNARVERQKREVAAGTLTVDEASALKPLAIHAVAFGADHPLRDLRIDEVNAPPETSLGDLLTFDLTLTNFIRHSLSPELRLLEDGTEVRKAVVQWRRMGQKKVRLYTVPEREGEIEYRFILPPYEDEINLDNNQATVHVKVAKRDLRVLLVAGQPMLEYHYLVPALLRDPIVKLSCFLQSGDVDYIQQGNAGIDRLPRTTREWNEFDVVVLADPDPRGLSSQQVSGLEELVRGGGGLLVVAGRCFGLDMLLQVHPTKLGEMLPVRIDKNEHPDYTQRFTTPFQARRTEEGASHPIMVTAADAATNERIWESFPSFYWHHPVLDRERGAVVLLERVGPPSSGAPLMAIRRYGRGAVFYSGLNSIWRWRYPAESYDYDRFWTRVVRYLGETRLKGTQEQVVLTTNQRVYGPGEEVLIILRILDRALLEQLRDERLFVTVTGPAGQKHSVRLEPDAGGTPQYLGRYTAMHLGREVVQARHVSAKSDSSAQPLFDIKHGFEVKLRSLEELDTSADLEAMRNLAQRTGGVYLDYTSLSEKALQDLAAKLPVEPQVLTERAIIEVWDGLGVLIIFLLLASAEWSLRKLWGVL